MGAGRIFSSGGKVRGLGQKSLSGVPGAKPPKADEIVKIMHK